MKYKQTPTLASGYTVEKIDDEFILYSEATTQGVYLNDSAHAVLTLCQEKMTIGQMIQYLEKIYPDQKEQMADDVICALKALRSIGVIAIQDAK
jgi:hypothetical protein